MCLSGKTRRRKGGGGKVRGSTVDADHCDEWSICELVTLREWKSRFAEFLLRQSVSLVGALFAGGRPRAGDSEEAAMLQPALPVSCVPIICADQKRRASKTWAAAPEIYAVATREAPPRRGT